MAKDLMQAGLDKLGDGVKIVQDSVSAGYKEVRSALNKADLGKEPVPPRAGLFDKQKYAFRNYMYPYDLMSPSYDGNYAIFYINVSEASKLYSPTNVVTLDSKVEPRMTSKLAAKNISNISAAVAQGATDLIQGNSGNTVDKVVGTLGLAASVAIAPENGRSMRRLKTAIALHVPNQLSVRYGMQWSDADTGIQQGIADGIQAALSRSGSNNKLAAMGAAAAEFAAGASLQKNEFMSAALGIAGNPKKEQVFRGVDFRKFTFDYQFFPRDADEAANIIRIIHEFKLHMHPEFKSAQNYVWIYPSEFDIVYYTKGKENPNIHRHTSCVLEGMNVNYTPNGNFSVFANGMPTQINMSLEFKELQILSKETIEGGL